MFVKPASGRAVRWPGTRRLLADAGENVPDGVVFWARCLRNGDVVLARPAAVSDATSTPMTLPASRSTADEVQA
ncbi:DUF2635 domain-containing protein [Gluconacetobacter sp. 1c LMG 22058]|uniref:DUF2635 domain-containing protein n=2 Tax=Gluconacetobacter dulcium TaxID=2729096 RepID=A0A7W4JXQ6_9PROT|nr:DUF2635 domain-containing protein [Gluconacetobacter dulcium]